MARHIMAVCVFCLLCADHLHCQQHVETLMSGSVNSSPSPTAYSSNWDHSPLNGVLRNSNDFATPSQISAAKRSSSSTIGTHAHHTGDSDNRVRRKRHADHSHGPSDSTTEAAAARPAITDAFVRRIFHEYGNGGDTINVQDFQRMLEKLGLRDLLPEKFSAQEESKNETCVKDSKLVHYIKPQTSVSGQDPQDHYLHHRHSHASHAEHSDSISHAPKNCSANSENCAMAPHDETFAENPAQQLNYNMSALDIVNICPVLLYQLASNSNSDNNGCISMDVFLEIDEHEHAHFKQYKEDVLWVWIYSFCSVFACSILGLVGVAIIPFMNYRFYKHIIQFFVSLAVGTMTGDALLHLLPHSLAGQNESNMIFKGLACMGGIVFFYITEHGLTMVSEWRKSIAKKEANKPSRAKVMRDPDSSHNNSVAGDKVCKSKYSSYPYCYDEIAMDTKNDVWMHLPNSKNVDGQNVSANSGRNGHVELEPAELATQSLLSTSQNNYAPLAERKHRHNHALHPHSPHNDLQQQQQQQSLTPQQSPPVPDCSTLATDLDGNVVGDGIATNTRLPNSNGKNVMSDTVTVILREHESSHHGHSHKHGHVHSPPESLSAVVWMIIMGDGLHNFTDGMAIGAAFAENIAGGFSTALAVFCHELPHELGDFAILMKAGMSVKSAVYYNLLTGVLSFVGMIFGIVFGQSHETAQWMFAVAAGLFIYIAMVDMMPEISAAHKSLQEFALQILGMSSGVLLMLLIAIFEGDLMNVFAAET